MNHIGRSVPQFALIPVRDALPALQGFLASSQMSVLQPDPKDFKQLSVLFKRFEIVAQKLVSYGKLVGGVPSKN